MTAAMFPDGRQSYKGSDQDAKCPPDSETPETDKAASSYGDGYQIVPAEFARRLERRLHLAQTEIKGHMRVAKEVRVDALEEAANVCEALGRTPRNGIYMASARACADAIRALKDGA